MVEEIGNIENTENTENMRFNNVVKGIIKSSREEPPCIKKARDAHSIEGLKLKISWLKAQGLPERVLKSSIETYFKRMEEEGIQCTWRDFSEILDVPQFSCDIAQRLGYCDEDNCPFKKTPADRLIFDTEDVIYFEASAEFDVLIKGVKKRFPIKKLFKNTKEGMKINTAFFNDLYLEIYLLPPNPPISEEDALKVYSHWLDIRKVVDLPTDPNSAIESAMIEIITSENGFIPLSKLDEVSPEAGMFIEGDVIFVESSYLRTKLEEFGINDSLRKVASAVCRLLAGKRIRIRTKFGLRYFWRFNVRAIKAILRREGDNWEPEIIENPLAGKLSMLEEKYKEENKEEDLQEMKDGTTGENPETTETESEDENDDFEVEEWDLSEILDEKDERWGKQ